MTRYHIKSAGFSGRVHLYEPPRPLDDTTVHFSVSQVGNMFESNEPLPANHAAQAVSISGNYLAISIPAEEAVEVYHKIAGTWTYYSTLTAGEHGQVWDEFGASISVSNNKLVVGAPGSDDGAGAVYAFEFKDGTWRESIPFKLQAINKNNEPTARFGEVVDLTGDTLVVGAPQAFGGAGEVRRGAVYGFTYEPYRRNWRAHNVLVSPSPQADSGFGSAIAVENENFLVVGAPLQNVNQGSTVTGAGSVFVFARTVSGEGSVTNWTPVSTVTHPNAAEDMFFGKSVHYAGDRLIVGAPGLAGGGGAFYFYGRPDSLVLTQELSARSEDAIITDATVGTNDHQGTQVFSDPSRKIFLMSSPGNENTGAVYVFEQTEAGNWLPAVTSKIRGSNVFAGDGFAEVIAYDGGTLLVGVPNHSGGVGGFYIFS